MHTESAQYNSSTITYSRLANTVGIHMNVINRSAKVPLYYQLYQFLLNQIRDGSLQPGDILSSEAEMVDRYHLSRSTVRQALDMLVNDGLIVRRRGQGTFVTTLTIEQNLGRIISFWEDMGQRGLTPATRVLSSDLIPAPDDIAQTLGIGPGEELANIVRLRLADDETMSVEHSFLVHKYCPGVTHKDFANHSLRQMLAEQYNIRLVYAKQKIRAIPATRSLAQDLLIEKNDPLLYIERVSFSDFNVPIEFLRIYLRGDRYTFFTELRD